MIKPNSKTLRVKRRRSAPAATRDSVMNTELELAPDSIIQYGVGFDVHKFKIALCLSVQLKSSEIVTVKEHVFRADPKGITEILNFLKKYEPLGCMLMECTGVYHIPLYHALTNHYEHSSTQIIAMNPLLLNRRLTDLGHHSDKADARGMAALSFYRQLLRPSYIGSTEFLSLRDLVRSYHKLQSQITGCRNRIHRALSSVNFKAALSLRTEWGLKLLDRWISRDWSFGDAYSSYIDELEQSNKSASILRRNLPDFIDYDEFTLPASTRFSIQLQLDRFLYVELLAATYLRQAERTIIDSADFQDHYRRLLQIPGIGAVSALTILVELGDFNRFRNWKALAKYCGVVPTIHQTGEFRAKGHVNRFSNAYLRKSLSQAGGVLVNCAKTDTDLALFAHRQFRIKRLPYKKAILKVAQKLARVIYAVLVSQVPYDLNYETKARKERRQQNQLKKQGTLMTSARTRALRRDIQDFFVCNFDFLNSTSKYHLVAGFERMVSKAQWVDRNVEHSDGTKLEEGKKKKKIISNGG